MKFSKQMAINEQVDRILHKEYARAYQKGILNPIGAYITTTADEDLEFILAYLKVKNFKYKIFNGMVYVYFPRPALAL